ncbi:MAG: hypothetical protein ABSA93_34570 [Streptosporangiaceae bacterium]|jgi:hypothetical protein
MQDEVLANSWAQALVPTDRLARLRSAIRSAALQLSVSSLTRDSLQRAAMWFSIPTVVLLTAAVPFVVPDPGHRDIAYIATATAVGAVAGVVTLLIAAPRGQALLHFALVAALAAFGVALEFPHASVAPAASRAFTAFCVTPAVIYVAFLPMIIVAYGCAWRLTRTVDPRARLVIGLLRCTHQIAHDSRWLHDGRARDQVAERLEQVARIAERDLPRLLSKRARDDSTKTWLREHGQLIGTRIRECKRRLLLSDTQARDAIRSELLELLLHATASEWDAMRAQQPPAKRSGLLRRYAPHAATGLLLIAAGLALPEILPALKGAAGSNLRTVLLLSGSVALVPLDNDGLNRIPDAFADAIKPN